MRLRMLGLSKNMNNQEQPKQYTKYTVAEATLPQFVPMADILQMAQYIGTLSKGLNDLQLIQMSIKSHEEMNLFPRVEELKVLLSESLNEKQTEEALSKLVGNIC